MAASKRTMSPRPSEWQATCARVLEDLRLAYGAEIERLAETLRPGFEAGELRGWNDPDDDEGAAALRLEDLASAHFGLEVQRLENVPRKGDVTYTGDHATAYAILAVSPSSERTEDGYNHVAFQAKDAAALDVLAIARQRGWYAPVNMASATA